MLYTTFTTYITFIYNLLYLYYDVIYQGDTQASVQISSFMQISSFKHSTGLSDIYHDQMNGRVGNRHQQIF